MVINTRRNSGTAYKGVEPSQPPQLVYVQRRPTVNDYKNYNPGTFWVYDNGTDREVYSLLSVERNQAVWVILNVTLPGSGTFDFVTDSGTATQNSGAINIFGDGEVITSASGNTVIIGLRDNIPENFVTDSGSATSIAQTIIMRANNVTNDAGSTVLLSAPGASNTILLEVADTVNGNIALGKGAGNSTLSGGNLTLCGAQVAPNLTTANSSTVMGVTSGDAITSGSNQTLLGAGVFPFVDTGVNNLGVGYGSGFASNVGTESSNIYIGNQGASESNTIRIGTQGNGAGQQDNTYIAGIYGSGVGGTSEWVKCDNTGKLGTTTTPPISSGLVLLATYDLAGKTTQDIPMPTGYTRFVLKIRKLSCFGTVAPGSGLNPLYAFSQDGGATFIQNTRGNQPIQQAQALYNLRSDVVAGGSTYSGFGMVAQLLAYGQDESVTVEMCNINTPNVGPSYFSRDWGLSRGGFVWCNVTMPNPDPVTIIQINASPIFLNNNSTPFARGVVYVYGYVEQ